MINLCTANAITGKDAAAAIENMTNRLYNALKQYRDMTTDPYRLENITEDACEVIAGKAWNAKTSLRNLLSRHPGWSEARQEVTVTVQREAPVDWAAVYDGVHNYAWTRYRAGEIDDAISWGDIIAALKLVRGDLSRDDRYTAAYQRLTNRAFPRGRKPSRIIRDILQACGIWDTAAGSDCQRRYAAWADMISHDHDDIILHLSIDPAIMLTISNPKHDKRGDTLVSCHSLNTREYHFSAGNSGYAIDECTMCLYTCVPGDSYTRKTSRQLYMLQGGTLVQSRMYNTRGATYGRDEYTALYRYTVQTIISDCMGIDSAAWTDWKPTCNHPYIKPSPEFAGYPDFAYPNFDCNVCHRADQDQYDMMYIGEAPICVSCGRVCGRHCGINNLLHRGAVCIDCEQPGCTCCMCGDGIDPDEAIYDVNGDVYCESCAYDYLGYCEDCDEYVDIDSLTEVWTGYRSTRTVCSNCLDNGNYVCCPCCDRWIATDI